MSAPRTVLLDNQILTAQRHGGISRYVVELWRNRDALRPGIQLDLRLPVARSAYLKSVPDFHGLVVPQTGWHALDRGVNKALVTYGLRPPRGWRKAAGIHHTFYRGTPPKRSQGMANIVTCYDMIPETLPQMFTQNPHFSKKEYLHGADLILSISEATATDMLEIWPDLRRKRVVVTHLGVGTEFTPDGPKYSHKVPYVLFVGQRAGYKDFDVLVQALAIDPTSRLGEVDLIAVGGGPFTKMEVARQSELGLLQRTHWANADDDALAALYRGASAFAFTSRYEGFGLPILEAFASRCPVALADTRVFREVAGNCARFFTPGAPEALAEVLNDALQGEVANEAFVAAGMQRASSMTWRDCALQTATAYEEVL